MAAAQTQTQVNPTISALEALFAAAGVWMDVMNLILVRALFHCYRPLVA